jgi:acyl-coenzyme A thioesterase PaaI-like protein
VGLTAGLTAEYHRPAYPPLTFKARAVSHGSTLIFVQVDVEDRDGTLCLRAQGTMVVRRLQPLPEPGLPAGPADD